MTYYIYLITNKINDKKYVGQTENVERRWKEHCRKDQVISSAIKKYGKENFTCEVLEILYDLEEANEAEIFRIRYHHSHVSENGYNVSLGGKNAIVSEETSKKISDSKKGKSNGHEGMKYSEEWVNKIKLANSGKKYPGRKNSGQFKNKLDLDKVNKIRELHKLNGYSHKKLSEIYNISQSLVSLILNNKRWTI